MAAKPKAKPKAKAKAKAKPLVLAAADTAGDPCNNGEEINSSLVTARPGGSVELRLALCGASAPAVADFDGKRVFSQTIAGVVVVPLVAPAAPGDYLLLWALAPVPGTKWRAQVEVAARTAAAPAQLVVQFRHRKASDSGMPVPKWAVFVRVIP